MNPEFKITQLRHFVWVSELKGFHAAAEKAHRTQPAISLSIRDLETKLGESLFEKRNSKISKSELTPFGAYFLDQAKELIEHHDRVAKDMVLLAKHKAGHLRLASVPSIASQILPAILEDFVKETPELHISFFDGSSDTVLRMVKNRQVDFGIASLFNQNELTQNDNTFIPIWEDQIGVVCPINHKLTKSKSIHWKALRAHRHISNGTSRLLESTPAHPLLEDSQFYVSNMISLIAMLEAGFGITTLPFYAFPKGSTKLAFIPLSSPELTRSIGIVKLNNRTPSPPAQALIDFILSRT